MRTLALSAAIAAIAFSAQGDILCGDRAVVLQVFNDEYGPWTITSTHRQHNTTVEVLNAPMTGTWAVMGENYRLQHCITVRQTDRPNRLRNWHLLTS